MAAHRPRWSATHALAGLLLAGCAAGVTVLLARDDTTADVSDTGGCWDTAFRCDRLVEIRHNHGLSGLDQQRDLQDTAEAWSVHMAGTGLLKHSGTPGLSEIVGVGPDWSTVVAAFMDSPEHRAIILDPRDRQVGIGAQRDGDRVWITVLYTVR